MPPQISLDELYAMRKQKQKRRTVCFDKVLDMCHSKIRTSAAYGGMSCFFEVPGMIVGLPLYNVTDCLEHIVDSLRKVGFLVQILPPPHVAVMYISWNPEDTRNHKPSKSRALPAPQQNGPPRLKLF